MSAGQGDARTARMALPAAGLARVTDELRLVLGCPLHNGLVDPGEPRESAVVAARWRTLGSSR